MCFKTDKMPETDAEVELVKKICRLGGDLDLISCQDAALIDYFGSGPVVTPYADTITSAIVDQMESQPHEIAAEWNSRTLTYGELNKSSKSIAQCLISQGVGAGDIVGIYTGRSFALLSAIVAVIRIGAAFTPMHRGATQPGTIKRILRKTHTQVVITDEPDDTLARYFPSSLTIIKVEPELAGLEEYFVEVEQKLPRVIPTDRCAVLFKQDSCRGFIGCQITHKNLCNAFLTAPGNLGMHPGKTVSQVHPIDHELAIWELLGALSNGAKLLLRNGALRSVLKTANILIASPPIMRQLRSQDCPSLETLVITSSWEDSELTLSWNLDVRIFHAFGFNETGIVSSMVKRDSLTAPRSLGCPIPNTIFRLLDEDMNEMPVGQDGEIWIGGDGLSDGYITDLNLTAARFHTDPFYPGEILFRTGVKGRWTSTGEIQYLSHLADVEDSGNITFITPKSNQSVSLEATTKVVDLRGQTYVASRNRAYISGREITLPTFPNR